MQNILLVVGKTVHEFSNPRAVLDWAILEMKKSTEEKAKAPTKGDKALDTILASTLSLEKDEKGMPSAEVKAAPASEPKAPVLSKEDQAKTPNSFDLPPMRKPFFGGGKGKEDMLSFTYSINGETPRARPADTARILFTKSLAFSQMPPKERDKVVNWGLSFLKKTVRETGKPASCETSMVEAYSIDRFAFLKGAKVTFRVAIKD